jgi:transcription elongation factor GreA
LPHESRSNEGILCFVETCDFGRLRKEYAFAKAETSHKHLNKYIMSKVSYYTEEGLKKLRDELQQLKDVDRPAASQAIGEARDKGDLSENAEYDAAKEAQGMLEMRISKLEAVVSNARIIDENTLDLSKALIHSTIKIKNHNNNMVMNYKLVAQSESDLSKGYISIDSPIGQGLLGKEVGDMAEVTVPVGTIKLEILEIFRD